MKNRVFVNGKVHIRKVMCSTCIFRPGNLMHLEEGRVEQMVAGATALDGTIPCHKHLGESIEPVCSGFDRNHATPTMRLAKALDIVEWVA